MKQESIVNCPNCGMQVSIILEPHKKSGINDIMQMLSVINDSVTDHFHGESVCKCGKKIMVAFTVTAMEK